MKCSFVSHFSGGIRKWQRGSGFCARRKMFYLVMWEGWKVGDGYMRHRRKWESLCECVIEGEVHRTCPSPPLWRRTSGKQPRGNQMTSMFVTVKAIIPLTLTVVAVLPLEAAVLLRPAAVSAVECLHAAQWWEARVSRKMLWKIPIYCVWSLHATWYKTQVKGPSCHWNHSKFGRLLKKFYCRTAMFELDFYSAARISGPSLFFLFYYYFLFPDKRIQLKPKLFYAT